MPLNIISKQDFVNSVRSSISIDALKDLQDYPVRERVSSLMLVVMVWSNKQVSSTGESLFRYYRAVANWIKIAHEDQLLSNQAQTNFLNLGIDPLLELVWDTTQEARGDSGEVLAYLHRRLHKESL